MVGVPANLYSDWFASVSVDLTCNVNALRELLAVWDSTHVSVLSYD